MLFVNEREICLSYGANVYKLHLDCLYLKEKIVMKQKIRQK